MREMIFWGATGQAKVLKECMKETGLKLTAIFDNNKAVPSPFNDVPIYYGSTGFEQWIQNKEKRGEIGCLVAIGGDRGKDRLEILSYLLSFGLVPLIARHPTAFIAENTIIAPGSQILANASVCVDVSIGKCCIINTAASVDHDGQLGDGVHICPGAHLAGCIKVGNFVTIYTGATILPRIKIGEGAIIGAGAVVTKDVPEYSLVVGNPARVIKAIKQS